MDRFVLQPNAVALGAREIAVLLTTEELDVVYLKSVHSKEMYLSGAV